jgi:PIN domain nuclease of toxin-antitoxin system
VASKAEAAATRLLLDTHIWLWMVAAPERLRPAVRELLADPATELFLSAASCWELAIKYRLGRLPLPERPLTFVPPRLLRDNVRVLPVDVHHALAVAELPDHHADPFDRLLVVQARAEGLTLVTVDDLVAQYDVVVLRG